MPLFGDDYSRYTREGLPGARSRAQFARYKTREPALKNPLLPQAGTLTVGGVAADGNYVFTFTDTQSGQSFTADFLRQAGETNNDIAAALIVGPPGGAASADLLSKFSFSVALNVITYEAKVPGRTYTVTTSAPGGATLVHAQAAGTPGGVDIEAGIFVARREGTLDQVRKLKTGDVLASIWGFVEREDGMDEQALFTAQADDVWRPGEAFSGGTVGTWWAYVEGDIVANDAAGPVYVRINGAGRIGAIGKTDLGADSIDISSVCRFIGESFERNPGDTDTRIVEINLDLL